MVKNTVSSPQTSTPTNLKRHLEPADKAHIHLLLRVPPSQRLQTMLEMQAVILNMWRSRLRRAHPQLSDLELCRLMFERLSHDV